MKNVHIGSITEDHFNQLISTYDPSQIIAIVDENTAPYLDEIHLITDINIDAIQLPSGENHKNIQTVAAIWKDLTDNQFRRDGLIINLGGGVITDMGGFAAATYKRGVDFINIPTTLLAMVDAAIGGKTGVDFFDFKNQIGVIKEAEGVFCDVAFLGSLPKEELMSGFAEVLKHGLVADSKYFDYCTYTPFEELKWEKIVEGSVRIKGEIVAEDPFEKGRRKLLNFGHTIGHALESLRLEQGNPILHGFGVVAGMLVETKISFDKGLINDHYFNKIVNALDQLYDRITITSNDIPFMIERMKNDKKNHNDSINFTLLEGIGKGIFNQSASEEEIQRAIQWYSK
ncbi:3-dehydroquinate synthase [Parvicella tangerina]|uniref:3-dehydroquinate synthase n=1 Tax=Parvicella tangerina TaxID=2829795 RepID=A0A916JJZ6_9FLAO|nr:3-dehydroquinate synthase [Parvicella tangerina]CAG5076845.1 3-dehydroquinate synthase [Parvicella tangerina]